MGFLTDKRGNFSWFRLSIFVLVLGLGFAVAGFVSFQLDQQSRRSPLFPDLPPGAAQWGSPEPLGSGYQRVYYRVPGGNVEEIAAFYNTKMGEFYGTSGADGTTLERCQRIPPIGEYTNIPDAQRPPNDGKIYDEFFIPGENLPYLYRCMFDRSGLNITQFTLVSVQPGVPNSDPQLNTEGDTVIVYEQRWNR
jgi:hypothetical protein